MVFLMFKNHSATFAFTKVGLSQDTHTHSGNVSLLYGVRIRIRNSEYIGGWYEYAMYSTRKYYPIFLLSSPDTFTVVCLRVCYVMAVLYTTTLQIKECFSIQVFCRQPFHIIASPKYGTARCPCFPFQVLYFFSTGNNINTRIFVPNVKFRDKNKQESKCTT